MYNSDVGYSLTLDQYRDRVMTEAAGFHSEAVTTRQLEDRLSELEESIFPNRSEIEEEEAVSPKPKKIEIAAVPPRKSIEQLLEEKNNLEDEIEDDFADLEEDDYFEEPEAMLE